MLNFLIINETKNNIVILTQNENNFVTDLKEKIKNNWNNYLTDKDLQNEIANLITKYNLSNDIYKKLYQLLINRDVGPKLAGFIKNIGKEKILELL